MFLCVRLRGGGQPKRTALDDAAEQTPAWKKLRTSDAESVEHLFAEDSALPISVSNERKFRGVRRQGDGFAASSKGQNVGVFPSAALAGLGYDFHNIAQHAANLTARAPILNFQDARKLYYAEVDEGRDPQAYLAALAAKVTRELSIHVNTHTQETDAAADAVAEGRGAQERIQSSSSKPGAAAGMLEFSELRAMARGLGLKSKAGWQRWVREKRKEGDKVALASYVEPRERFKTSGFVSWEDFLGFEAPAKEGWQKSKAAQNSERYRRKNDVTAGSQPLGESANPLQAVVETIASEGGEEAAKDWREQALVQAKERAEEQQRKAEEDRQLRLAFHRASRIERSAARYKAVNTVTDFLFPGCGWSKVEPPAKTLRGKTLERRKNEGNEDPEVHSQATILLTAEDEEGEGKERERGRGGERIVAVGARVPRSAFSPQRAPVAEEDSKLVGTAQSLVIEALEREGKTRGYDANAWKRVMRRVRTCPQCTSRPLVAKGHLHMDEDGLWLSPACVQCGYLLAGNKWAKMNEVPTLNTLRDIEGGHVYQHIVRGMGVSRIKSYRDEHLLCAHNREELNAVRDQKMDALLRHSCNITLRELWPSPEEQPLPRALAFDDAEAHLLSLSNISVPGGGQPFCAEHADVLREVCMRVVRNRAMQDGYSPTWHPYSEEATWFHHRTLVMMTEQQLTRMYIAQDDGEEEEPNDCKIPYIRPFWNPALQPEKYHQPDDNIKGVLNRTKSWHVDPWSASEMPQDVMRLRREKLSDKIVEAAADVRLSGVCPEIEALNRRVSKAWSPSGLLLASCSEPSSSDEDDEQDEEDGRGSGDGDMSDEDG